MSSQRRTRYWRIAGIYVLLLALSFWARSNREPVPVPENVRTVELQAVSGEKLLDRSVRLAYWERSSGNEQSPAVILLHGSPGQSRDLIPLAEQLPGSHRLIIPDLPGFGHSDHNIPDYSIRAHAHYVRQLLDHVRIERAHIVGLSMGGGVALNLANTAPSRVASLTMISAIGVQEMELLGDYRINHGLHGLQLAGLWLLREGLPHMGWLDNARFNVPYARSFYDSDQRPLRQILSAYQGPMLIVHGQRDRLVPVEAALEHHRLVPQSQLHLIDDNHFAVFTHPAILAQRLSVFLVQVDKGRAATRASAAVGLLTVSGLSFDAAQIPKLVGVAALILFLLLVVSTFVSEDLTCIAAGVMVAQGRTSFVLAAAACLVGIYAGDLLLFLLGRVCGRPALKRAPLKWFLKHSAVAASSAWFANRGFEVIVTSRFLPGTRLPTYFAAGLLHTNFATFAAHFLLAAVLWTPALVGLSAAVGAGVVDSSLLQGRNLSLRLGVAGMVAFLAMRLLLVLSSHKGRRLLVSTWRRVTHWEFWPPWVFYPPVLCYIILLALKHRSLTLFTAANPAMPAGGFIGESKAQILRGLSGAGDYVARFGVIEPSVRLSDRFSQAKAFMLENALSFPVVLKPDAGQRGSGVAIIGSDAELEGYLLESQATNCSTPPGSLAANQVQSAAPSPVPGERVAAGRVRGQLPTKVRPFAIALHSLCQTSLSRLCGEAGRKRAVKGFGFVGTRREVGALRKPQASSGFRRYASDVGGPVPSPGEIFPGLRLDEGQATNANREIAREVFPKTIIQEYVPGAEFGVFYYRYPNARRGCIFSITEKRFPRVSGDGKKNLETLILDDERAVCMAKSYVKRLALRLWEVPKAGESIQLVELGTHCRGAVFLDGSWIKTEALEAAIDRISKAYDGFYFGRYDIRTPCVEDFKQGRNFKVVELNGVTSEATHIYDPKSGLRNAYQVLFEQWRIAFEIGAQNSQRRATQTSLSSLANLIFEFKRLPAVSL